MGSLSLNCPLCCGEEFTSYDSLKYHILSITDNLLCPACNNRFDSFLELAEHLGRECGPPEIEDVNIKPIRTFADVAIQSNLGPLETNANSNHGSDGSDSFLLRPKVELEEDNTEMNKSILAKALLGQQDDGRMDMLEGSMNPEEVQQTVYTCQMCNIDFHSIEEHLEKYHEGQEVLLESHQNLDYHEISATESDEILERELHELGLSKPMVEEYLIEEGQIKKITHEEAEMVINKKEVIPIYQCPKCFKQFPDLYGYKVHRCKPLNTDTKFQCIQCTAVFLSYKALYKHLDTHKTPDKNCKRNNYVSCTKCKSLFPSRRSLSMHYTACRKKLDDKTFEPECKSNAFVCNVCDKTFDKKFKETHMKSHSDHYGCTVCQRRFTTKDVLEMHAKTHDDNRKKFACSLCKATFWTYDALTKHTNETKCQERKHECSFCGKKFKEVRDKMRHERIHTGEKPYVCKMCGKAFRATYQLTGHLRIHTETKKFQCEHCGKCFVTRGAYKDHRKCHFDEKPYACPFCPKAFKTRNQLAGHRNFHIKPFSCTICSRPFPSLYLVKKHMQVHKIEKNNLKYKCRICGATYARDFGLRDHMKGEHGEDLPGKNEEVEEEVLHMDETEIVSEEVVYKNEEGEKECGSDEELPDSENFG